MVRNITNRLLFFCVLWVFGNFAQKISYATDVLVISPSGYESVKAKVIDYTPKNFTINVKSIVNLDVDQEAPYFAIYTATKLPKTCADFRALNIDHWRDGKYKRVFNLTSHLEVLSALDSYKCIIVKNIPSDEKG